MRVFLLPIIMLVFQLSLSAQTQRVETSDYVFWQQGTKLKFTDFSKEFIPEDAGLSYRVKIPAVLELPKDIPSTGKIDAKWYIAPAFDKKFSSFPQPNENDLLLTQLYFDISEYWSRLSRQRIEALQDLYMDENFAIEIFYNQILDVEYVPVSTKSQTERGKVFAKIVQDIFDIMYMSREQMSMELFFDVYLDDKTEVLEKWRKEINQHLESNKRYATSETECQRFINNKSFDDNYHVVYEIWDIFIE